MTASILTGLWLGLAAVLLAAAVTKLKNLTAFEVALVKLAPQGLWRLPGIDSRRAARLVCGVELAIATSLVLTFGDRPMLVAAVTAALLAAFAVTTAVAVRLRRPCGCGGGSGAAAHPVDAIRSGLLAALAVAMAGLTAGPAKHAGEPGLVVAAAMACLVIWSLPWLHRYVTAWMAVERDDHTGTDTLNGGHTTRRAFLARAAAALAVSIGASALTPGTALAGTKFSCQGQMDLCTGCCGPDSICRQCCITCYYVCQMGGACAPKSDCNRCWPGPYPYG